MSVHPTASERPGPGPHGARAAAAAAGLLALFLLAALPAAADPPAGETPDDAFQLIREQSVTGPGKRPLPLSETPSSVTVVTASEIGAMGYHTVADALRWVRGVFITGDRNYQYVGVRGLQRPGDYNNKVLLAIDGHTTNGCVYADALIGSELGLDMDEVERIEVIRGPGSTLYGSYAVLAIVNVVTRRPRSEAPVTAGLRAGGPGEWWGRAAVASALPGRPEWHASLSWLQSRGLDLYYPEFDDPATAWGRAIREDGEHSVSFFGSGEWGPARLTLKLGERAKALPTASWGAAFGAGGNKTWDGNNYAELSASQLLSHTVEVAGRAWWDGPRYHGHYVYAYAEGDPLVQSRDFGNGDLFGAEGRLNWAVAPGHALTLGIEGQRIKRAWMKNEDVDPYFLYYDYTVGGSLLAVYAQDEVHVGSHLLLTAGARLDNDSRYDAVVSPRADLVWSFDQDTRLKLLGGSAFRAPAPFERENLQAYLGRGPTDLQPERIVTFEGTLERETGPLTTSLTAYSNRVRDLIDLVEVDDVGNEIYANRARVRSQGLEGELRLRHGAATSGRLALAWQESEDGDTGAEMSNSPRWNAHALVVHAPPQAPYTLGLGVRYLSSRLTLSGRRTAAAVVCDGRVTRRLGRHATLGLEVRNLFDARYGDPASLEFVQEQLQQDPRLVYVTLTAPAGGPR